MLDRLTVRILFAEEITARKHAALRGERVFPPRHELAERHVQPPSAGGSTGPARPRLPAVRPRAHARREAGW